MPEFQQALRLDPRCVEAHLSLGDALAARGRFDEAIGQFRLAIELRPHALVHNHLGRALLFTRRFDQAVEQYREAVRLKPDDADAHYNLGDVLALKNQFDEAIQQYRQAIRMSPDREDAINGLAWLLATCPVESLRQRRRAVALRGRRIGYRAASSRPCSTRWPRPTPKRTAFPRPWRPCAAGPGTGGETEPACLDEPFASEDRTIRSRKTTS